MQDGTLRRGPKFNGLRWPQFIPGQDRLIYAAFDEASQQNRAVTADYGKGSPANLTQTDSRVQYAPPLHAAEPGDLLYIRGASLLAQHFDPEQVTLTGDPTPIAQNVIYYRANLSASFSVSQQACSRTRRIFRTPN